MSRNSFATPNLNPKSKFKKVFPIEVGKANNYRLMPAPVEQSSNGDWYLYQKIHYGYQVEKENNGEKYLVYAPFFCVEVFDFNKKKIVEHCPECDKIAAKRAELDDLKKVYAADKTRTEAQIKVLLDPHEKWLQKHSLEKKYYVHAMNEDRQFSYLKLGKEVFSDLRAKIKKLDQDGLNAFDFDSGVWWNFTRTGEGRFDTKYGVEAVQESVVVEGRKLLDFKRAPLSEEEINQAAAEAINLKTLYPSLPVDTIQQLVESDGTPASVSAILSGNQKRSESPRATAPASVKVATAPATKTTATTPTVKPEATSAPLGFDPNDPNVPTDAYLKVFGE